MSIINLNIVLKKKKPSSSLFSPTSRIPSPLRCLTSVFGMGTGVSTAPSPPDFFKRNCSLKTRYYHMRSFLLIKTLNFIYYFLLSKNFKKLSPRSISISQLNTSPCLHFWPINLLTLEGTYFFRMGSLIFRLASRLDAFSVYPFRR